jgi:hypothetical protein
MTWLILTMALVVGTAAPPSDEAAFASAILDFQKGASEGEPGGRSDFARAAQGFTALVARGYTSADLFANQAKAYYLAGELPRAILAFRQGLALAPENKELMAGLARARRQVAYPEDGSIKPPALYAPLLGLGKGFIADATLWVFCLGALAATAWYITGRYELGIVALVLLASWLLLAHELFDAERVAYLDGAQPLAMVTSDGAILRRGNGEDYPPATHRSLRLGMECRLLFRRGDWVQIEFEPKLVGWLPASQVLVGGNNHELQ